MTEKRKSDKPAQAVTSSMQTFLSPAESMTLAERQAKLYAEMREKMTDTTKTCELCRKIYWRFGQKANMAMELKVNEQTGHLIWPGQDQRDGRDGQDGK